MSTEHDRTRKVRQGAQDLHRRALSMLAAASVGLGAAAPAMADDGSWTPEKTSAKPSTNELAPGDPVPPGYYVELTPLVGGGTIGLQVSRAF